MARDSRVIPPTQLTRKWMDQDVNNVSEFSQRAAKMPNDYTDWDSLHGKMKKWTMTKKELAEYNAKVKK